MNPRASHSIMVQLGSVTSIDANPKRFRVVYETAEECRAFQTLPINLGWKSGDLGLATAQNLANTKELRSIYD